MATRTVRHRARRSRIDAVLSAQRHQLHARSAQVAAVQNLRSDVLVVGASAAGLAAARAAALAGAEVTLLESREEVGVPEPAAVVAFDFLWTAQLSPRGDEVRRRLDGARIQSPGGHALEVAAPLSLLDRARFDQRLAREAQDAGARILTGVRGLAARADRALVADGLEACAPVVIFADGPGTHARRFIPTVRHPESLVWGAALRVPRTGALRERLLSLTFGEHAPCGRSQLNPVTDEWWTHWTFYRGAPSEARDRARRSLELDARLRGWDPALAQEAEFLGVAPDPVLTLPRRLAGDGVMAVGGAAGQGGLEMGVAAGETAGEVAAAAIASGRTDARALAAYEREWKRRHMGGYRSLRRATMRLSRLDDEGIDRLLAPWSGWRIPVRDFVGLAHPDPVRRVEAFTKFAARNPHALPGVARVGLKAMWPF